MLMGELEICGSYRNGGCTSEQISILADLNACPRGSIETILVNNGYLTVEHKADEHEEIWRRYDEKILTRIKVGQSDETIFSWLKTRLREDSVPGRINIRQFKEHTNKLRKDGISKIVMPPVKPRILLHKTKFDYSSIRDDVEKLCKLGIDKKHIYNKLSDSGVMLPARQNFYQWYKRNFEHDK